MSLICSHSNEVTGNNSSAMPMLMGCKMEKLLASLTSQSSGGKHFVHSGLYQNPLPRDKSAAAVKCKLPAPHRPTRELLSTGLFLFIVYLQLQFNGATSPQSETPLKDEKNTEELVKSPVKVPVQEKVAALFGQVQSRSDRDKQVTINPQSAF